MKRGSEWLSKGAEILAAASERGAAYRFDFVIVGSGYGGAVAAARLALAARPDGQPLSVCILERGLEYLPGDFPDRFDELPGHVRFHRDDDAARGVDDGLFDLKLAGDVSALVANGLGGGSLINAGVAEEASTNVLADIAWPAAWRGNPRWAELYTRARERLSASRWSRTGVPKDAAMQQLGERLQAGNQAGLNPRSVAARPVTLTIAPPQAGGEGDEHTLPLHGCQECGDCFSGCNVGAKVTLSHNYLRDAFLAGAELFTGALVHRVVPEVHDGAGHRWVVEFKLTDSKRLYGRDDPFVIHADNVVLAAGTFGTTELLFRSRGSRLRLSPRLGERFSANGDTIGAQYGLPERVECYGDDSVPRASRKVGPTITQLIDLRGSVPGDLAQDLVVEDMTVPAPLAWLFGEILTDLMLPQRWQRADWTRRVPNGVDPYATDDGPQGAVRHSLLVATQGNDGASGRLEASLGGTSKEEVLGVRVTWPDVGELPCYRASDRRLKDATPANAYWIRNPGWQGVPDSPLLERPRHRTILTVHPLGGCAMADSWRDGVVDAFGRVYSAPGAEQSDTTTVPVHPGLFVIDGSIVPVSLGINPLLTITALAEGCLDALMNSERWAARRPAATAPKRALPRWPVSLPAPETPLDLTPTAVQFLERMAGPLEGPGSWKNLAEAKVLRLSLRCEFGVIKNLGEFLRASVKQLDLKATLRVTASVWHEDQLRHVPESAGGNDLVLSPGTVAWFEQQEIGWPRRTLRSAWAWLRDRATADLAGRFLYPVNRWIPGLFPAHRPSAASTGVWGTVAALFRAFTHFGAPRLLRYEFGELAAPWCLAHDVELPAGTRLFGSKVFVYAAEADPWRQLTRLPLMAQLPSGESFRLALLTFDELYMLDRDRLPLKVLKQANGLRGVRDVGQLALFFGRAVAGTHFPSFRAPDYARRQQRHRLPEAYAEDDERFGGLRFEQHDFTHPIRARHSTGKVTLRLTHIRGLARSHEQTPILMIHGFGSGGVQFTHKDIPVPMAAYLATTYDRDIWVGELRTSIGLGSSLSQWSMDDIAQEDVPALVDEVLRRTGTDQLDVLAHCIGSAMFCMAALSGRVSGKIRRATLMQVGPVVHLPRTNRFRGYLGHRAQQWLGAGFVESTMDDDANDSDRLLDRVLGTYSYLDRRLPGPRQLRATRRLKLGPTLPANQRRLNALRSNGVFGQLFQWTNLDDKRLLDAMPDLLGLCNLTTYQQTVYYTFVRRLTNQAGEDVYVTDENIRKNFAFPVLFIQGDLNDTFDRRGTLESLQMLKRIHGPAHPAYRTSIPGYGHLDCVVGKDAAKDVFPYIGHFLARGFAEDKATLDAGDRSEAARASRPSVQYREPMMGPWLGHASLSPDGSLSMQIGIKADDQRTPPPWVVTVALIDGRVQPHTLRFHRIAAAAQAPDWATDVVAVRHVWPEGEAALDVRVDAADLAACRRRLQLRVCSPFFEGSVSWPARNEFLTDWSCTRRKTATAAALRDIRHRDRDRVDQIAVLRKWLDALGHPPKTRFALGCCRQTPLLMDRDLADLAFRRMLSRHVSARPIEHLLMVGDQIYADALASAESIRGTRTRFFDAHREAWVAPYQRDLMRRMPVYMAVDDHEFTDNYDDAIRHQLHVEFGDARQAWWRYQLMAGPAGLQTAPSSAVGNAHYAFRAGGCDYFVCDTRTRRHDGGRIDRSDARIMDVRQDMRLRAWLKETKREGARPRFIVLPSPLVPWFADAAAEPQYAVRSDSWQRFPRSFDRMLELLFEDGTGQIVLLCGDYHVFVDCLLEISDATGKTVSSRCLTTPGIYCPYTFANTEPRELLERASGTAGLLQWSYVMKDCLTGSGYTLIEADDQGVTSVEFNENGHLLPTKSGSR